MDIPFMFQECLIYKNDTLIINNLISKDIFNQKKILIILIRISLKCKNTKIRFNLLR